MKAMLSSLLKVPADLDQAERQGVLVAILLRTLIIAALLFIVVRVAIQTGNPAGLLTVLGFLGLGGLHYALIRSNRERRWHRLAFLTADFAGLAGAALLAPLSGSAEVPQIVVFRVFGTEALFILIAISVLSLTPSVVLWAGFCAAATIGAISAVLAHNSARVLTWSDLPPRATREQYLGLLLDPDFIGGRTIPIIALISVSVVLAVAVARARGVIRARIAAEKNREQVRAVFSRYVPQETADAILADGGALAPAARTASVLFIDIEGFTQLSERLAPESLAPVLNEFFDMVDRAVAEHHGIVVSFIGDAVLCAFNLPVARSDFVDAAVRCGRAILATTGRSTFGGQHFTVRLGLATGPVAAGSFGGAGRQSYTVYGDTVNLAQRLEDLNKELRTGFLVCEQTMASLSDPIAAREAGLVQIRGRSEGIRAFVLADRMSV
jgi:class 3 adenylate cyclase